ncbi:hypothetical protein XENOCAPTIV_006898, partial [Xenoophorus captivus]
TTTDCGLEASSWLLSSVSLASLFCSKEDRKQRSTDAQRPRYSHLHSPADIKL